MADLAEVIELHGVDIVPIAPQLVGEVWDVVVANLEDCIATDYHDVRIEDVYAALRSGAAQLHIGWVGTRYVGCMVVQHVRDQYGKAQ